MKKQKEAAMVNKRYILRKDDQLKISSEQKKTIDRAAKKIVKEYGKTLKLLAKT